MSVLTGNFSECIQTGNISREIIIISRFPQYPPIVENGGLFYMVSPGYFRPEKPINREKTGVVHPPTPHPPILALSVSKFTHPNIHPSTIPTLQQKAPNCLYFLPIIHSYIEWYCRGYRTTTEPFLVIRAKRKKNASESPVVRASLLTDNWCLWYALFPL